MAFTLDMFIDHEDIEMLTEQEMDAGRQRLMELRSRVQAMTNQIPAVAKMIRKSTEPFMELVIRRSDAEQKQGKAVRKWFDDGSDAGTVPNGHDVPDPESVDPRELRRLSETDFRTVCLFRVGRLASTGQVRSYLATPVKRSSPTARMAFESSWMRRGGLHGDEQPMLDPRHFPPDLAREMVEYVERLGASSSKGTTKPGDGNTQANTDSDLLRPMMSDLASEVGISDDTFRRVRTLAGIVVSVKGAAARRRRYSSVEVDALIDAALRGSFIERKRMEEKWAKWGTAASSRPQDSK